jgi:hypothetical protein
VIDSTPVKTAGARETVKRAGASRLGDAIAAAAYGYCPRHSRWFCGIRLDGAETVIGDTTDAGRRFASAVAVLVRPPRNDKSQTLPRTAMPRQRIESISWTANDLLDLERPSARTLHGLRVRLCRRFLALAAAIALNRRLGRPSRSLAP